LRIKTTSPPTYEVGVLVFLSLPKKWRQVIVDMLEDSKKELILYVNEINDLERTLQIENKK